MHGVLTLFKGLISDLLDLQKTRNKWGKISSLADRILSGIPLGFSFNHFPIICSNIRGKSQHYSQLLPFTVAKSLSTLILKQTNNHGVEMTHLYFR